MKYYNSLLSYEPCGKMKDPTNPSSIYCVLAKGHDEALADIQPTPHSSRWGTQWR